MSRFATARQRVLAWMKTNGKCAVCGRDLEDNFEVDHVIPWSRGGETEQWNLRALCQNCNRKRGAPKISKVLAE